MTKLLKRNGKKTSFTLTNDDEIVLQVIYYQTKSRLASKGTKYPTESLALTKKRADELIKLPDYRLRKSLKRLNDNRLIKVYYITNKYNPIQKLRCVSMNLKKFDENYYWSD